MCQLSSKGGVAQPLFLIGRFFMIHTCSLSMDLPDKCQSSSQLFPTQTCKKKKTTTKKAWYCDHCLACLFCREHCIASHLFEIWNNYVTRGASYQNNQNKAWVFADLSELSVGGVVIFPPLTQSAGFLEMERAVFNFFFSFFFFSYRNW